jgi:hypothetical protein
MSIERRFDKPLSEWRRPEAKVKPPEALTPEEIEAQQNRLEAQQNTEAVNTAAQAIENASEEGIFTELTIPEVEKELWGGKPPVEEASKAEALTPEAVVAGAAVTAAVALEKREQEARERERLIGEIRRTAKGIFSKDVYGSQLSMIESAVNYLLETVERKGLRNPRLRNNYFELLGQLRFHGERILESLQPGKKWLESESIENLIEIKKKLEELSKDIESTRGLISSKAGEWGKMLAVEIAKDAVDNKIHQQFGGKIKKLLEDTKKIYYKLLKFEEVPERRIEEIPAAEAPSAPPVEEAPAEREAVPTPPSEAAPAVAAAAPRTEAPEASKAEASESKFRFISEDEYRLIKEAEKLYDEIDSKVLRKLEDLASSVEWKKRLLPTLLGNRVEQKTGEYPKDVLELELNYGIILEDIETFQRNEIPLAIKAYNELDIEKLKSLLRLYPDYLEKISRKIEELDKRREELWQKYQSVLEEKPGAVPKSEVVGVVEAKPETKSPEERRLEMELREKEQKLQNATYEDLKRGFGTYINLIDNEKIKKELLGILDTVSWQYAEEFISGQTENAVKNLRKFERETLPLAIGAALITSPNRNEMRNEIIRFFKDRPNILRKLQESQGEMRINLYETSFIYVRDKKEKRYKNEFAITIDEESREFLRGIQLDQKYLNERDKEIEEINELLQQLSSKKPLIEKERNALTELKNNLDVLKRSGVKKVVIEIGGQDREIGIDELEKRLPQIENSIKQMSNLLEAFSKEDPFRFEGDNIEVLREHKKTLTKVLRELEDLEKRMTLEEELKGKAEGKTGPESPQERAKELKNQTNRVKDLFNSVARWTLYAGSTSFKALTGVGTVLAITPFAIFKKAIEYFRKTKSPGAGLLKSIIGESK